jgi:hypothetical protein
MHPSLRSASVFALVALGGVACVEDPGVFDPTIDFTPNRCDPTPEASEPCIGRDAGVTDPREQWTPDIDELLASGDGDCRPDGVELCNGLDDDCDGSTDEGWDIGGWCQPPGTCGAGALECGGPNSRVCSTGPGGSQYRAPKEVCDGVDQDCDGRMDEDTGPQTGPVFEFASTSGRARMPTLAAQSGHVLAAWEDDRDGSPQIYGTRIRYDRADPPTRLTDPGDTAAESPLMAWGMGIQTAGVVWREAEHLRMRRIGFGPDGGVVPRGAAHTIPERAPAIAWTGSQWAIAGLEPETDRLTLVRLSAAGEVLGRSPVVTGEDVAPPLHVAAGGDRVLATATVGGQSFAAVFNSEGEIRNFGPLAMTGGRSAPAAAWNDVAGRWALAFEHNTGQLRLMRMHADAEGGDGAPAALAAGGTADAQVVWNGREYGVAWSQRTREGTGIYFARVSEALDNASRPERISPAGTEAKAPALIWSGLDFVLAWEQADGLFVRRTNYGCPVQNR